MQTFTDAIRNALASEAGLDLDEIKLELPRNAEMGDFAFPCFVLAKKLKNAPPKIAAELEGKLNAKLDGIVAKATGPYLNFKIDRALLASTVLNEIMKHGERYGSSDEGAGKHIVIDLSSPNIAKPMSVGHLRSTVIGAAVQRVHDFLGYETTGINHIGDWGSQFGKLVVAVKRWGDTVDLENNAILALFDLYGRYHEEEEQDPSLDEDSRAAFRELESGVDGEVRALWHKLTDLSMVEFNKVYTRLGVTFDEIRGEAYYESHLDKTVDRIVESGITEISDGALVVDLSSFDKNIPPCLLRKSDGTTLYATRDFAAAFHRWELYEFTRCLYVVGGDQRLHFRQLKLVLERMGMAWEPSMEHIDFGMMRLPEGKMSTRKKRVVFLEDVLDAAVTKVKERLVDEDRQVSDPEHVAEAVGVGAVIFNDLRRERIRDVEFDWDEVLSFQGETGPYVQYTHARLAAIERKVAAAGGTAADPDWAPLENAAGMIVSMGRFQEIVRKAATEAEPSVIAAYLLGLCREVNSWLHENRVLGQEPGVTAGRLAFVGSAKSVIGNGLRLLGLIALEEM
ncbi:MAG: arginyl-tRNA synthetase [Planctomycetota bacterium]|jgi:arginyl-tRNA synthetase